MRMTSPSPRPLPANYQRLCPWFNKSHAEEMARWAKDLTLVHRMLYAFIFQDAIRFKIRGKDVMVNLAEAIDNCRCAKFEAWLDAHHDLLLQQHEVEALNSSVKSAPFLLQRGIPSGWRNVDNEATSSASSPKTGHHGKK